MLTFKGAGCYRRLFLVEGVADHAAPFATTSRGDAF
jgi:hypothetical protein